MRNQSLFLKKMMALAMALMFQEGKIQSEREFFDLAYFLAQLQN